MSADYDFTISTLGEPSVTSPIQYSTAIGDRIANFVDDSERVVFDVTASAGPYERYFEPGELLERAGPRQQIYFFPGHLHAGIVTCGGMSSRQPSSR